MTTGHRYSGFWGLRLVIHRNSSNSSGARAQRSPGPGGAEQCTLPVRTVAPTTPRLSQDSHRTGSRAALALAGSPHSAPAPSPACLVTDSKSNPMSVQQLPVPFHYESLFLSLVLEFPKCLAYRTKPK